MLWRLFHWTDPPPKPEYEGQDVTRGGGWETHEDFLMPPILQPASPNTTTRPRTKTFPENDPPAEKQKHSLNARREGKMATVFFF